MRLQQFFCKRIQQDSGLLSHNSLFKLNSSKKISFVHLDSFPRIYMNICIKNDASMYIHIEKIFQFIHLAFSSLCQIQISQDKRKLNQEERKQKEILDGKLRTEGRSQIQSRDFTQFIYFSPLMFGYFLVIVFTFNCSWTWT